jgi:mannose-6-phosphate isomerase-like protein (cupin superfamily)
MGTTDEQHSAAYTHVNLESVDDSAAKHGFGEMGAIRFATDALKAQHTGLSHHRLNPGRRQGFGHRHDQAEEVYVVLGGSGRVKIDDEIVELQPLDAIRIAPQSARAFEAGPDGIELLAFGQHHEGDGEILPGWWTD